MKKIKILTIILIIALITMISFFGVYVNIQNRMEDKTKQYEYAMDLKGTRNIKLVVDKEITTTIKDEEGKEVENSSELTDEEIIEKGYIKEEIKNNEDEVLTLDNYKKTKQILEKRLEQLNAQNYTIKLNEQTGEIIIELSENDNTDIIVSNISTVGKFEIIDTQTNEVLMDNNDIKLSNVMYGSDPNTTGVSSSGTAAYLNIEFNKEGKQKLEEISNTYIKNETKSESTETTAEEEESQEETEKTVTMKIDNEEMMSTSFDEPISIGKLQLSVGKATTDNDTLQEYVQQASNMATVLDTGNLPIKYNVEENKYVLSDITNDNLQMVGYIIIAVVAIALIILVIKYKFNGLLGAISYIGLVSMFLLLIRYANVVLSIEGIFAIVLIMILNYIFISKWLSKLKVKEMAKAEFNETMKETYKGFFIKIIPICIMVITFCFMNWTPISSFGMVMFWGISLIAIYHSVITNSLLRLRLRK